jgi:hypothetical protein
MKQETKELYLNKNNKCGGFYELAIQVCSSENSEPIKLYTNYIWNLNYIYGPLDNYFQKISINNNQDGIIFNNGILKIKDYEIPFLTINICEENGFNWFDISIYTQIIEKIFGNKYVVWNNRPKIPKEIKDFFDNIVKELYKIYPFLLGVSGFEVSGLNYIENIINNNFMYNDMISNYYIGSNYYDKINKNNIKIIKIM